MRAGTDPLNEAAVEYAAAQDVALPAIQRMWWLGLRWERQATVEHRDDLVASLEALIPKLDRMLAVNDKWLRAAVGRLSAEDLGRARLDRNKLDHHIGMYVTYMNKVSSAPTVTGGSPS